jgi:hypothetical protein
MTARLLGQNFIHQRRQSLGVNVGALGNGSESRKFPKALHNRS